MKNKQKSRSGCRTCKVRRLRCDETKPACRNCQQKGFECPGYQQRLQWSTKHERPWNATASGPTNFNQLVTAASEVIAQPAKTSNRARATTGPASDSAESSTSPPSASSSSCSSPAPESQTTALVPFHNRTDSAADEFDFQFMEPSILQPVVNIPSFLIEHWFKSVCGSWSALDSADNPYRQLTSDVWSVSKPVYYALQAISAASLVERLPLVMQETARQAPRMATDAIKRELVAFFMGNRRVFPSELLLSLFCMSSSMAWLEWKELGLQYLRQARAVLKTLETWDLDEKQKKLLEFFNGCLIYEEMLRSVVSDDEVDIRHMLSWEEPSQTSLITATPHPWSGVSSDVFRLFGKAVALCRRSRARWRHNAGTSYRVLQGAMQDIEEATVVEDALLTVDADQVAQNRPLIGDTSLYDTTEAYRLSSLLQLYETFPDLAAKRMPQLAEAEGSVVWQTWVTPLALHIVGILEQLPVESMRCIQPLLCLCAGSGLRYESRFEMARGHQSYLLNSEQGGKSPSPGPALSNSSSPEPDASPLSTDFSDNSIKTSQARHFVMHRLDQLELSLPPKPINVAKQLMRAVWAAYDEEIGTSRKTHWLDVMSNTGLHSIFG